MSESELINWDEQNSYEDQTPIADSLSAVHNPEANGMASNSNPTIIVLGVLNGSKVIKGDWPNAMTATLSDRTVSALEKLGMTIHDEPSNYVF